MMTRAGLGGAFVLLAAGCSESGGAAPSGGAGAGGTEAVASGGAPIATGEAAGAPGAGGAFPGSGGSTTPASGGANGTAGTPSDGGAPSAGGGTASGGTGPASPDAGSGIPVCGDANEGDTVTLTCPDGLLVGSVHFASYGTPTGSCGSFTTGSCHATGSSDTVAALCIGRSACTIAATNAAFGDPCSGTAKHAAVEVSCEAHVTPVSAPFKGVANSPCAARTALDVSWYYNWMQNETEPCQNGEGGEFVPMVWGHTGSEQSAQGIASAVSTFAGRGQRYVLGFNEPDNSTQANIPVSTALSLLPSFDDPAITIVSPATQANANPGQAWFSDFMTQLAASSVRVDVLGLHWYGWNAGSCDASASQLESYIAWAERFPGGRPIWLTEWGCLNQSAPDVPTVITFYQGALAVFARHPRVERYAWYPWATNCGLNDQNGALTPLGEAYAAAPAYR